MLYSTEGLAPEAGGGFGKRGNSGRALVTDVVHADTAVYHSGAVTTTVTDYVVAEVESGRFALAVVVSEARIATVVMSPQVMVQSNSASGADERAVAVFSFGVRAVQEALGDERPLNGNVLNITARGEGLVDRKRTTNPMVYAALQI